MKYAFALAALAGLASANIHARHERLHHRDAEATVTDWTVVTVTDVVTVFGPSPVAEHTAAPAAPSSHATHSAAPSAAASHPAASSPAAVSSPAAAPSSPAAVSSPAAAPNTPAQQPTTLATVPKNEATSAAAAPTSAAAAPTSAAAAPSGGSGSGSGSGSYGLQKGASIKADCPKDTPCQADMTTYTPGMGSCGYDDSGSDDAVALQIEMFGTVTNSGVNSPSNPLCNKKIFIKNPATGETATGVIRDACPGCTHPQSANSGGIDLALPLFQKVNAGATTGRNAVEWYFMD